MTVLSSQLDEEEETRRLLVQHHQESKTIDLPLAGKVKLTIIRFEAPAVGSYELNDLEASVRIIEDFMKVPFPRTDVILLFATPEMRGTYQEPGETLSTHIVMLPDTDKAENMLVTRELGHYYWGAEKAPPWFREGAASFLASYVALNHHGNSLTSRKQGLSAQISQCKRDRINSLQLLLDRQEEVGFKTLYEGPLWVCNDWYGEILFISLYATLGSDNFKLAWAEMYESAKTRGRLTEDQIYDVFRRHTPPIEVRGLIVQYSAWHGR